jgi:hypothetical protein
MVLKAPAGSFEGAATVLALAGAAVLVVVALAIAWPNTADDAYITLRYARHLSDGHGIVWNPGEPAVEGYSNFLFVILGAALMKLGGGFGATDPMSWLKAIGALTACGTLILTYWIAARRFGATVGAAAVVALATHPGQAFWAVSGMETTVSQFLIVLSVCALLGVPTGTARATGLAPNARDRRFLVASLALFAASITRPESLVVLAAFIPFAISDPSFEVTVDRIRGGIRLVLPFLVLYLPYTAWRLWHFGRWLPNSAACKAGYSSDAFYLGREFLDFAGPLLVCAAAGVVLGRRHLRRDYLLLLGIPLIYFVVFLGVDPVMSHLDRHFLAPLPLIVIAAVAGLCALADKLLPQQRKGAAGVIVLLITLLFGAASAPTVLSDVRRAVRLAHPLEALRRDLGAYLQTNLRPGEIYAIGDTGLVPFLAGGVALDLYCLNCREATMPPIERAPDRLADWVLSRRPRFIVIQASNSASNRGVWPADRALQAHPTLEKNYSREQAFGGGDDPLHYLVFERRVDTSL